MTLSPAFLDELRTRTLLSGLIGRTVKLTRAGREWKACCPFHNEKTPSFTVNDEKGFYHCFGCSAHGDAIGWMTEKQGLPFMDAVKELAQNAGMEVPAADPRAAEKAQAANGLYDVMTAAAAWFAGQLGGIDGTAARAYLKQRAIAEPAQRTFGLGLAPDSRSRLKSALERFGNEKLVEAGLLIRPEGGGEPYDRFRGRLMIPIRDRRGRVIAFGGRILGAGEPKYLNSPETPLFDKGRTLFNLDYAGPASRATGRLVVVEGNFDVISLAQAGMNEVVAPLGTAVSEEQLQMLWRLVDVPTLSFDGDDAGQNAAARVAKRALPSLIPGKSLNFALLPKGEDPDSLLQQNGLAKYEKIIEEAAPLGRFLYGDQVRRATTDSPEGRAKLRASLDELSALCADRILRDEYRRFFTSAFFEDYGWNGKQRQAIASSILKTGPHGNRKLLPLFVRSALYGVSLFPIVASMALEPLHDIKIDHPQLAQWREDVVEAVENRPRLDMNIVAAIIDVDAPSALQKRDLQIDLRFPYMRVAADPAAAARNLLGMLHFLADEQYLTAEMEQADREAATDSSLARYELLEAKRQVLRERRSALNERGYQLGTSFSENDGMTDG